jgi:hypothetical protein
MPWLWLAAPAIGCLGVGLYVLHNTLKLKATQMAPQAPGLSLWLFGFFCSQASRWVLPWARRWSTVRGPSDVRDGCHRPDFDRLWFRSQPIKHSAAN